MGSILASFLLCALCPNSTSAAEDQLVGRLETVWVDPVPSSGIAPTKQYTLTDDSGRVTRLSIDDKSLAELGGYFAWNGKRFRVDLARSPKSIEGRPKSLDVREVLSLEADQPRTAFDDKFSSKPMTDAPADEASKPWVVLLCKYLDVPEVSKDIDFFEALLNDSTVGLNAYWRELSYEHMNLDGSMVVDWVTLPHEEDHYRVGTQGNSKDYTALFDDCTAAADPIVDFSNGASDGFAGIAMVFNGEHPFGGVGSRHARELDGVNKLWGFIGIDAGNSISHALFAHEMGHAFGLPHSDNGDFDNSPYDNPWDVMSYYVTYTQQHPEFGAIGQHTNATYKAFLGWISPSQRWLVGDLQRTTLTIDAMAVTSTNNYRSVTIPIYRTADDYTVEVRKRFGEFDGELPGDAVIIYKNERPRPEGPDIWVIDVDDPPADYGDGEGVMFRVGETYRDETTNISIKVEAETSEGFVVHFDARSAPEGTPCKDANILLESQADVDNFQSDQGPCDTIEGSLVIGTEGEDPSDITNLLGLADVTAVHRDLNVGGTSELVDLGGLDGLQFANNVHVFENAGLTSFSGLGVIATTRILQITDNAALFSLAGLESLESVHEELEIALNQNLGDCVSLRGLLDWVDDHDLGPDPGQTLEVPDVGGPISIHSNAAGCNSIEEIAPPPFLASALIGSWYDPARNGTGFMLHGVNENLAVGYYYGFDNEGDRFWLIGVHEGPMEWGEEIRFEASYVTGGSFENFDPDQIEERLWGTFNVIPFDCERAFAQVVGQFPDSSVPQSFFASLIPLASVAGFRCFETAESQPTDGITGSWYDPGTAGQGLVVHKSAAHAIVYFYGFDESGEPLWLIGVFDGSVEFGSELLLGMRQVTGGTFQVVDPDQIVESSWGDLRLRFDSCSSAWAELSGEDGTQVFNLVQLAGSAGLECAE